MRNNKQTPKEKAQEFYNKIYGQTPTRGSTEVTMSNNKQSSIDFLLKELEEIGVLNIKNCHWSDEVDVKKAIEQAKEKYEHEMCVFADEYASYILDQSKLGIKGAMVSMCAWTFFKNRRNEQR